MNHTSYDSNTPDIAAGSERAPLSAVAQRLRDDILHGTYRAGERLPGERELAARLGVHRGAVREALKSLGQIGLVSTRPGGTVVCALQDASIEVVRHLLCVDGRVNRALVRQLLDVHEMVVSGAARLAVERGSDDELGHARELLHRLADPSLRPETVPGLMNELVELITLASGNLVLRLLRNTIRPALSPHVAELQQLMPPALARRTEQVRALDEAVGRRDGAAAEEAVRAILQERREGLMRTLARLDAAPAATGEAAEGNVAPH